MVSGIQKEKAEMFQKFHYDKEILVRSGATAHNIKFASGGITCFE